MSFRSIALLSINIFTLSLLLLASPFSHAQNYPVQVNVNVATPCPVRLSSLFPGASSRVNLMVLLTDISQPELQVRLRITLEGPGLTLTTRPEFLPIPFTLYGGMPVSLQTELAPYFTTTSLMASGSAASSFTQSGMLPEGMYKLTVQAIEHRRNVVVSNAAMAMAWAIYNDPPEPIQPMNNQVVDAGSLQNVLFTWAPRHILTPGAGGQIGYTLSLWEVPQGVNPELAVQTLPAIGTIESYSPTAIWGPDRPMLIPGKQYAYRIQAADPTGEVAFKNSGNSVVRAFTFGTPCSKPVNLSHSEVTIQSARTAWVPLGGVANFAVEYRPALEEPVNWRSYEVQGSTTTLSSLAPATEYKYRVKSVCGSYHSDPTAEKSFTTLPLPNLDNPCTGDAVAPPVANAPLLDNLQSLQVISAGGFLVTIDEVIRTAPYTFSGKGRIAMPLFNTNVKGTFKNIQVNSLLQLTSGKVESVKSETLTVIGGNGGNPNDPGVVDFGTITDTVHITSPIDTVYMNPDSTWTVVTTNGGTVIVTPPSDGTGVLVVDPDGNGVVITADRFVPYTAGGNNDNGTTTPITPTTLCDEQVEFTPNGSMHRYGYDPYRTNAASLYQQLQVGGETLNLAYKSVPQGAADAVYVKPQGNGSLNGVTYAYQSGAALTATQASGNTKSLFLPAPAGGSDNLLAMCSMDTTSREAAVAGALSVVSYPLTRHRVAIVPVGNAQPSFSVTELRTQLNAIYAPAVIEWEVTQLPAVTATYWDENNDDMLQIPNTDYSPEMRGVWQAFLANNNPTPGTAYLFIVSAFDSSQYKGYMPVQSNYGFLTPSATPRNAAHELGHGLFNLWHTFSTKNIIKLQKESTQNLMDYSSGTELWKYQWDFTHSPEGGWFVFEDSEEGGMTWNTDAKNWFLSFINKVRDQNTKETPSMISPNALDKWRGKVLYITDIQIGGVLHSRIGVSIPNSDANIETTTQIINNTSPEIKGFNQVIKIDDFKIVCFNEKPWDCAFLGRTEFSIQGWNSFVDAPCVQFSEELNSSLEVYLNGSILESSNLQRYIVAKERAKIRSKEPEYGIINSDFNLEKGREVELISHLQIGEKPRSLIRYKGEVEEFCTSTENLKEIIHVDDSNKYKIGRDSKSIALPFSENEHSNISTLSLYDLKELCGEYSHIFEKDGDNNIDKGWMKSENLIKYNNFENLTLEEKLDLIIKKSKVATEVATEMTSGTACNFCVRNALYLIRSEPALFPKNASSATYRDPDKNKDVKVLGYITEPGQAKNIKIDFDKLNEIQELNERFVEIKKTEQEEWVDYFLRLQNEADNGIVIIGIMLNASGSTGHVMMITPGGVIEITREDLDWGYTFVDEGIEKVPRVLECGDTDRENEAPLCRNVDRRGAQQRLKWFKYTK